MTEVIHIENRYITQHLILSGEPREGDVVVKDWKGNVGDSIDFYNKDWTKKSVEQLLEEHLIEPVVEEKVEQEKEIECEEIIEEQQEQEMSDVKSDVKTKSERVFNDYTRTDELMIQLSELDFTSIRSIRAILSGTDTEEDHKTLEALEKQAINLRKELNTTTVTTNK